MSEDLNTSDEILEKLKQESENNLAGWKRAMADYQNLKRETEMDRSRAVRLGAQTVISAILPAIDHFDEAVGHIAKDDLEKAWVKGIMLIKKEMEDVLKQFGIEEMKCVGEEFNPVRHEAVGEADAEGIEPGKIIKELQKGYTQNGEILRTAKVIISK